MTKYSRLKALSYVTKKFATWMADPYYTQLKQHTLSPKPDKISLYGGPLLRNLVALSTYEVIKTVVTGKPPDSSSYDLWSVGIIEGSFECVYPLVIFGIIKEWAGDIKNFWNDAKKYGDI